MRLQDKPRPQGEFLVLLDTFVLNNLRNVSVNIRKEFTRRGRLKYHENSVHIKAKMKSIQYMIHTICETVTVRVSADKIEPESSRKLIIIVGDTFRKLYFHQNHTFQDT